MEDKVREVGRPAGMLASTREGIWAKKFIVDTGVSHPMDLLAESWQEDGRMREHNPTRLFWVIARLTGNQWTRRNPIYLPPETVTPTPDKPGNSWAQAASSVNMGAMSPRASVRLDDSALKKNLRQVKMTGNKTKHVKYYAVTLSVPKASDPAMKFHEIVTLYLYDISIYNVLKYVGHAGVALVDSSSSRRINRRETYYTVLTVLDVLAKTRQCSLLFGP